MEDGVGGRVNRRRDTETELKGEDRRTEGWKDGRMGGWEDRRMGGWEDRRMGGWEREGQEREGGHTAEKRRERRVQE